MSKMITKKELESWFDKLFQLIVDCSICTMNLEQLTKKGDEVEEKVKLHGFFQQHYFQLRFVLCIQLDKLFSSGNNQKYSFHKLLNRLEHEKYDQELKERLSENKENDFTKTFKNREDVINEVISLRQFISLYDLTIEKVHRLRDTIYAHTDNKEDQIEIVTIDDFRRLTDLAAETSNKLTSGFFGSSTKYNHTNDWNIGFVLKRMVEDRKNFMKGY
jgi:hypothetical protein